MREFTKLTKTPSIANPTSTLIKEFDSMVEALIASLQGEDESQIVNEVDLLGRIHQHRRAILTLKGRVEQVQLYQPEGTE